MIRIKLLIIHTFKQEFVFNEINDDDYEIVTVNMSNPEDIVEQLTVIKPQAIIINCGNAAFREIFFCSKIRRNFNGPIIIVTSNSDSDFQTTMLECGADDFINLPVLRALSGRVGTIRVNFPVPNEAYLKTMEASPVTDKINSAEEEVYGATEQACTVKM